MTVVFMTLFLLTWSKNPDEDLASASLADRVESLYLMWLESVFKKKLILKFFFKIRFKYVFSYSCYTTSEVLLVSRLSADSIFWAPIFEEYA